MDEVTFNAASQFTYGLIAVLMLLVIVLSFVAQIRRMKKEMSENIANVKNEAASKAREETRSEMAFNDLKKSVEKVNESIARLNEKIDDISIALGNRVNELENGLKNVKHNLSIIKKEASVANKRLDEHKKVDHGFEHIESREYNEDENEWED